jgi:hypothetical protein
MHRTQLAKTKKENKNKDLEISLSFSQKKQTERDQSSLSSISRCSTWAEVWVETEKPGIT